MYQTNTRDLITKLPQSKQNTFNEQIFKSR